MQKEQQNFVIDYMEPDAESHSSFSESSQQNRLNSRFVEISRLEWLDKTNHISMNEGVHARNVK